MQGTSSVTSGRWLGRNADDCADGVVVNLKEPLGTRSVVDQSTGNVVEVLPDRDVSGITALLAAHVMFEVLALDAVGRRGGSS